MRKLSFLASFPQTSAHTSPGGTTKLLLDVHTHVHTDEHQFRHMLVHKNTVCTIQNRSYKSFTMSYFYFELYFMLLHPTRDPLHRPSDNPSITVKQCTFHGSISYSGNKLLFLPLSENQWFPWFISPITFFFTFRTSIPPHFWKKKERKRKACSTTRYGYVCMATVA